MMIRKMKEDPTAAAAISNAMREEHKYRPLVYICSLYTDDPDSPIERLR